MIDCTDVRMTKQQAVGNGVQISKFVDVFYIASDKELLISITVGRNSPRRSVLNCVNQYIFLHCFGVFIVVNLRGRLWKQASCLAE